MKIARSCRQSLSVPAFFWTSIVLFSLACGVSCTSEEQVGNERSPSPELLTYQSSNAEFLYKILRELAYQEQQRLLLNQQLQNFREESSSDLGEYEKLPLPLPYHGKMSYFDESKENSKRGSYMSLCHFKICNMGKRGWVPRYRK